MDEQEAVSALMSVLRERWVMTLALDDPEHDAPYPTPLFFALAEPGALGDHAAPIAIFTSAPSTRHGQLSGAGPRPACAAVYLESEVPGQLRGAQLRGLVIREDRCTPEAAAGLRARYLERHRVAEPMLAAGRHRLYALLITWGKTTDNRLGFGAHPVASFGARWSGIAGG